MRYYQLSTINSQPSRGVLDLERPENKEQLLGMLHDVFNRWEEQLAGTPEAQLTDPSLPGNWSVKDVMAHLWAWQQRTLARTEAALHDAEPQYPKWPDTLPPDPDDDVDQANDWIYKTNRDKPWPAVYSDWRGQFLRILDLSEQLSQNDLFDPARYTWMGGYPLAASYFGSYDHHKEHIEKLRAWLAQPDLT